LASLFQRFGQYRRRKRAAAKLGFSFHRSRDFTAPSSIRLLGKKHDLHLPDDHGTRVAFLDILLDDCYALRDLPKNIGSVLDIGAHAGLFSLAARMRFPDATIHAYEPNPAMLQSLRHQAYFTKVRIFPEAVGATPGAVNLLSGEDSVHARVASNEAGTINCVAFADAVAALEREPILVKLDCEGAEWEILNRPDGWDRVAHLTMEYHLWSGYNLADLRGRLVTLGFAIKDNSASAADFGILTAHKS
jgi:FkbM family methyltransferase